MDVSSNLSPTVINKMAVPCSSQDVPTSPFLTGRNLDSSSRHDKMFTALEMLEQHYPSCHYNMRACKSSEGKWPMWEWMDKSFKMTLVDDS